MAKYDPFNIPPELFALTRLDTPTSRMLDDFKRMSDAVGTLQHPALEFSRAFAALAEAESTRLTSFGNSLEQIRDVFRGIDVDAVGLPSFAHETWLALKAIEPDRHNLPRALAALAQVEETMKDSLKQSATLAELSRAAVGHIDLDTIDATRCFPSQHEVRDSLLGMTDAFRALSHELRDHEPLSLPRIVFDQPPAELFIHTRLLSTLMPATEPHEEEEEEEPEIIETLSARSEQALPELLARLDPDLLRKWAGAREALLSSNPDRVAHVAVSIREVFRAVLHQLAPAEAVVRWASLPDHLDKGRPTRIGRFEYIVSQAQVLPLAPFFRKDFAAALESVRFFDQAIHETTVRLTHHQLRLLVLRVEQFLCFLIELAESKGPAQPN